MLLPARVAFEGVGSALSPGRPHRRGRAPLGVREQPALVAEAQTPVASLAVIREAALRTGMAVSARRICIPLVTEACHFL